MALFKIIYWIGQIAEIIIRAPYQQPRLKSPGRRHGSSAIERAILLLLIIGFIIPLIYTFTNWLGFADYRLPLWMGWMGVPFLAAGLFVFWRAHTALKNNWSPTLEIYGEHTLVTEGIYRTIRHPMYLSQWFMVIAQMLLLQNWIAGPIGMAVFIPFYLLRVKAEEQMMEEQFGAEYRDYMQRTGRILPKF